MSTTAQKRHATAYLDGLRGVAALSVVFLHLFWYTHGLHSDTFKRVTQGYGWNGHRHFVSLPIIKLLYHGGTFSVSLFYVLSGYVLSVKPIRLMTAIRHDGDTPRSASQEQLVNAVGSAFFRRWFRLFLPIIVVDLIYITCWQLLGFQILNQYGASREPTFDAEISRFWRVITNLSNLFTRTDWWGLNGGESTYNMPTWTIPDELRGSMVIFTAAIAFSHMGTRVRLVCEMILAAHFIIIYETALALFVIGMFLCDLSTCAAPGWAAKLASSPKAWLWNFPLLVGLWFGGIVDLPRDDMDRLHVVGAVLAVVSIANLDWCKTVLSGPVCRYLGRISYGIYLVHLPFLNWIGGHIYAAFGRVEGPPEWFGPTANMIPLPDAGPLGLEVNVIIPGLVVLACCVGLAELATRFIDDPCVKCAQWLYDEARGTSKKPADPGLPVFVAPQPPQSATNGTAE